MEGDLLTLNIFCPLKDGTLKADFVRQIAVVDSVPTDLLWDNDESLLIACANGKLVRVAERIVPEEAPPAAKMTIRVADDVDAATSKPLAPTTKKTSLTVFDDDSSNDGNAGEAVTKNASSIVLKSTAERPEKKTDFDESDDDFGASQPVKNRFIDDEAADEEDDDDDSISPSQQSASPAATTRTSSRPEETTFPDKDDDASDFDDYDLPGRLYDRATAAAAVALPEPQPAFAPSSSPLDLPRRFLCWNHIGSVTLRRDDTGQGRHTVDINFTDSGFRRPVGFTDNLGFILGSLGEDGGIFATDLAEDDDDGDVGDVEDLDDVVPGLSEETRQAVKKSQRKQDPNKPTGSSIYFHRFETFASLRDKDWHLMLPNGERALGCATGEGWAAVMTKYVAVAKARFDGMCAAHVVRVTLFQSPLSPSIHFGGQPGTGTMARG